MKVMLKRFSSILFFIIVFSCSKDDKIEYPAGSPNVLAGNWVTFEFQGGNLSGRVSDPFDMVTSLDPNRDSSLIIDKMYASDVRVRAKYDTTSFSVTMGEQLESISQNTYHIAYISVDGNVSTNPALINLAYQLASLSYPNIAFSESDIKDVILIHAGFYDSTRYLVDTTLVLGYRKTGFEDVQY
jgi:hypothetical protein